jgi:hypothetical protein
MPLYTLNCKNCSAPLQVKDDVEFFLCAQCGTQHVLERSGGTISYKAITESISKVQAGTDRTAAELEIRRLKEDLHQSLAKPQSVGSSIETHVNSMTNHGCIFIFSSILAFCIFAFGGLVLSSINFIGGWGWFISFLLACLSWFAVFIIGIIFQNKNIKGYRASRQPELDHLGSAITSLRARIDQNKKIADG